LRQGLTATFAWAGLGLSILLPPPPSRQAAGITGMSHHAWLHTTPDFVLVYIISKNIDKEQVNKEMNRRTIGCLFARKEINKGLGLEKEVALMKI
jgi:hypothetical protein